jgi:cell filamentation protein
VTFDPFDDFETRGYLRNLVGEKDLESVKRLEHRSFLAKLDEAFSNLRQIDRLTYSDVLDTHKTLFEDVYPWAGQDRAQTAPEIAVSKGSVLFAHPNHAKIAVEHALRMGQDKTLMADMPGEVMGYLAYGHPFLDGNGRTIMVVHSELAERAGISVDWAATDKAEYLTALTCELNSPGKGYLDAYLKPLVGPAIGWERLASHVARTSGLAGNPKEALAANEVLGKFSDPVLQARYRQQEQRRSQSDDTASRENTPTQKQGDSMKASDFLEDRGRGRDRGRDR